MNMLTELVAESFLSAVFDKLIERLASADIVNCIWGKKSIDDDDDDQLEELKLKLKKASLLLNDAENRQLEEPVVKEWLDDLKDVIYRAQDLVDEIDYDVLSKKLEPDSKSNMSFPKRLKLSITSSSSKSDKTVKGELYKILYWTNFNFFY